MEHIFIKPGKSLKKNFYFVTAVKSEIERSLHQIINNCRALKRLWQMFHSEICKISITPAKVLTLGVQLYSVVEDRVFV